MENLGNNIRYAFRVLAKSPGFTLIAAATLALGIGANTAIFSVIYGVLLQPLPYANHERLISITAKEVDSGLPFVTSLTKFEAIEAQTKVLESVGAYIGVGFNLTTQGDPEQIPGILVTSRLLETLGVRFTMGRGFRPEEDRTGGENVAVISDAFWHNHMGGDPNVIGRTLTLDTKPTVIVGVLPASFRFPFQQPEPAIWMPRVTTNAPVSMERIRSGASFLVLIGRLRPSYSLTRASAELATINDRYKREYPGFADASRYSLSAQSLEDSLVGGSRPSLLVLLGAVGLVLLIACVNVASLVLVRASSRVKEFAIRAALGGSRRQIVAQLLTENILLALGGGALGAGVAWWSLPVLVRLTQTGGGPGALPRADEIGINATVLLFSLVVCCLTGLVFGLAPALAAARRDPQDGLKESARGATVSRRGKRMREWMVVAEVALALVLMTAAGLLIRGFVGLLRQNLGFSTSQVLTIPVALPAARYPKSAQRIEFYRALLQRVRSVPGVESAGATSQLPLSGAVRFVPLCPEGTVCQGPGKDPTIPMRQIDTQFFASLRIPLVSGRGFEEHDNADAPLVGIINSAAAAHYFQGLNPVGRHIRLTRDGTSFEIIGVIGDIKFSTIKGIPPDEMYVPFLQSPWLYMTLTIRTKVDSESVAATVRRKVTELDRDLPLGNIRTMDGVLGASVAQPRLIAQLVGGFAGFALMLTSVGIYGLVAFTASQRKQEMAIRMALGARASDVLGMVVGQGMRLVAIGLVFGAVASLGVSRWLGTLSLAGVGPRVDLLTITGVCGMLLAVAAAACYMPAKTATKVDALHALRSM